MPGKHIDSDETALRKSANSGAKKAAPEKKKSSGVLPVLVVAAAGVFAGAVAVGFCKPDQPLYGQMVPDVNGDKIQEFMGRDASGDKVVYISHKVNGRVEYLRKDLYFNALRVEANKKANELERGVYNELDRLRKSIDEQLAKFHTGFKEE